MKLATLPEGSPDGKLIVVSSDGTRFLSGETVAPTLQAALDGWALAEAALRGLAATLENGEGEALQDRLLAAPLPRAWQWLDGSAFDSHGRLMAKIFGIDAMHSRRPLMYQGMSHRFLGPRDDVPLPLESHGIDFEGEFGVITGEVPMGCHAPGCGRAYQTSSDGERLVASSARWSGDEDRFQLDPG